MPLYPILGHDQPKTLPELLRRSRTLSPWPALLSTGTLVAGALSFVVLAPDSPGTYVVLACALGAALTLATYWSGPLVHRRRWLLTIAERAAYGYLAFRVGHPGAGRLLDPPDVDDVLELTLRLEGTAPFLLRPGERDWLRATTALLIQTES